MTPMGKEQEGTVNHSEIQRISRRRRIIASSVAIGIGLAGTFVPIADLFIQQHKLSEV